LKLCNGRYMFVNDLQIKLTSFFSAPFDSSLFTAQ